MIFDVDNPEKKWSLRACLVRWFNMFVDILVIPILSNSLIGIMALSLFFHC